MAHSWTRSLASGSESVRVYCIFSLIVFYFRMCAQLSFYYKFDIF